MTVNEWREIEYTDDGCKCSQKWESRTNPAGWAIANKIWKFCPYCGTQWEENEIVKDMRERYDRKLEEL